MAGSSTNAPQRPWNRILTLTPDEIRAIGLKTEIVKEQTEPTELRLFGTTDYDPATVTVVRTQFDSRVEEVLVDLGNTVKVDTPLLELFSTELAEAKSNYEAAISQWERDKKVLEYKTELAKNDNLAKKELIEAENDEAQSRLKKKLARDKLLVYGLTDKEIENARKEDGVQKAQDDLAVSRRRSRRAAERGEGKLLHFRRPLDDHRASRSPLGARERQRARC